MYPTLFHLDIWFIEKGPNLIFDKPSKIRYTSNVYISIVARVCNGFSIMIIDSWYNVKKYSEVKCQKANKSTLDKCQNWFVFMPLKQENI